MPTYLAHGFRWSRAAIRTHIIVFDLEEAATEWIVAPATAITLLNSFYTLYKFLPQSHPPVVFASDSTLSSTAPPESPDAENGRAGGAVAARQGPRTRGDVAKTAVRFNDWSVVKLLEQYDPEDEVTISQPYAYVADYVVPVTLSLDIGAEMAAYEERQCAETEPLLSSGASSQLAETTPPANGTSKTPPTGVPSETEPEGKNGQPGWFKILRDQLAATEPIGWYVVVCGDEERTVQDPSDSKLEAEQKGGIELRPKTPKGVGFRGLFGKKDRRPLGSTEEK